MGTVKKQYAEGANSARHAHSRRKRWREFRSAGPRGCGGQEETGATGPTRSEGSGAEVEQRGGQCVSEPTARPMVTRPPHESGRGSITELPGGRPFRRQG